MLIPSLPSMRRLQLVCSILGALAALIASPAAQEEGWITHTVAISPDRSTVVLGRIHAERGGSFLIARDVERNEERARVPFAFGPVRDLSFSADSSRVVTPTSHGHLRIYDLKKLELLHDHAVHENWGLGVALSPDGELVASSSTDLSLRLRVVATGEELWQRATKSYASAIAFLPSGKEFVVAHHHEPLRLWTTDGASVDLGDGAPTTEDLKVSDDGKWLASAHNNGELRLWKLSDRTLTWSINANEQRTYCISFTPDGEHLASSGSEPGIKIWNRSDGTLADTLRTDSNMIAVRCGVDRIVGADYEGNALRWQQTKDDSGAASWQPLAATVKDESPITPPADSDR